MSKEALAELQATPAVVVVGGGAAGIGAALGAARAGHPVVLVERRPAVGGTVAHALIHTIGGLLDSEGELLNGGLAPELLDRLMHFAPGAAKRKMGRVWTLTLDPLDFRRVAEAWIDEEGVTVLCGAEAVGAKTEDGRVVSLEVERDGARWSIPTLAAVDASGTADVARTIDPRFVDPGHAAAGLILVLSGVEPEALEFPNVVGLTRAVRKLADEPRIAPQVGSAWIDRGVVPGEAYLKLALRPSEYERDPRLSEDDLRATFGEALRGVVTLAEARIERVGQLGIRDGGRIRGDYVLTRSDVMAGRSFPDGRVKCCWPIEHWDPSKGVELEYLPEGCVYEIPLRSLKVKDLENLWAAGKILSAEPLAQASARVSGSCFSMGDAVGRALSTSVSQREIV